MSPNVFPLMLVSALFLLCAMALKAPLLNFHSQSLNSKFTCFVSCV